MKGGGSIIVEASSQGMDLAYWKLCHLQQSQAKYMQSNTHLSKNAVYVGYNDNGLSLLLQY